MLRVVLVFIFAAVAFGVECNEERIKTCMLTHFDINNDTMIDESEIDSYILHEPCGNDPIRFNGMQVISFCDVNKNGYLDVGDYDERMGCVRVASVRRAICKRCDMCETNSNK